MKYNVVLFGVKTETKIIYEFFRDKIDLLITLNDDERNNYHISGKLNDISYSKNTFFTDNYKLDSKYCDDFFNKNKFDLGLVVGWQRLIPQKVLDKFRIGIFGFHASPLGLPFGRGRSPVNWSIIKDYKQVYNHCFKYNRIADDGEIYNTTKLEIYPWDDIGSMKKKSLIDFKDTYSKLINDYEGKNLILTKQDKTRKGTFFPKRKPSDGKIDLNILSTLEIYNLVRGVSKPFPGAFLEHEDSKIVVWKAQPFSENLFKSSKIGEVVEVFDDYSFIIKTINSTLLVSDYYKDKGMQITKGMVLS